MTRISTFLHTRTFHVCVLMVGLAFILTGAFHGEVWFDESYSVAIANHSFSEIWRIGSGDVHPVLFYWFLHVLNLVFGQNILVYRLFTAAGTFCLALLGLAMIRRDFGWCVGVAFSFFVLFMPYIAFMAVEIRMYSWASFFVMLCALCAWRIACSLRADVARRTTESRDGWWSRVAAAEPPRCSTGHDGQACHATPLIVGVPWYYWALFFLSSLACAYLHYYGVIAAFVINLFLLVFLVLKARRALLFFLVLAVAQVALYAPWLSVLAGQMGVVSGSYWANVVFPRTFVEWAFYPVYTSQVVFADTYGMGYVVALWVCTLIAVASVVWGVVCAVRRRRGRSDDADKTPDAASISNLVSDRSSDVTSASNSASSSVSTPSSNAGFVVRLRHWVARPDTLPALLAAAVYLAVFGIALAASVAMDSLIVYYRYLSVALGPLVLALAIVFVRLRPRVVQIGLLASFVGVACVSQALFVQDAYSPKNEEPITYFVQTIEDLTNGHAYQYRQGSDADALFPLVLSADIGFEGVTAVQCRDVPQTFLAWQPGDWALAYESYAPTLTSVKNWNEGFDWYTGKFIVLGQTQDGSEPVDMRDLQARDDVDLVSERTFYRPYERTWFTVAVMEKH